MEFTHSPAHALGLKHIGWKTYNSIVKKAVDQEFSGRAGGLIINLSIAFFIVIVSAYILNFIHQSLQTSFNMSSRWQDRVYQLETIKYLPILEENYLEYNRVKYEKLSGQQRLLSVQPLLA